MQRCDISKLFNLTVRIKYIGLQKCRDLLTRWMVWTAVCLLSCTCLKHFHTAHSFKAHWQFNSHMMKSNHGRLFTEGSSTQTIKSCSLMECLNVNFTIGLSWEEGHSVSLCRQLGQVGSHIRPPHKHPNLRKGQYASNPPLSQSWELLRCTHQSQRALWPSARLPQYKHHKHWVCRQRLRLCSKRHTIPYIVSYF